MKRVGSNVKQLFAPDKRNRYCVVLVVKCCNVANLVPSIWHEEFMEGLDGSDFERRSLVFTHTKFEYQYREGKVLAIDR